MFWYIQSLGINESNQEPPLPNLPKKDNIDNNISNDMRKPPSKQKKALNDKKHNESKAQSDSKIQEWRWGTFCKTYKIKKQGFCYEKYIEEKCRKKNDFKLSYKEYAKQHMHIRSCRYGDEDENLQEAIKENRSIRKQFFEGVKR